MKTHRAYFAASLFLALGAVPRAAAAQTLFADQPQSLTQGCNGSGCWTNYVRMTDIDSDGDLDLVAVNQGGLFTPVVPQPLLAWRNDGNGGFTDAASIFGTITAPLRQVAFGDVDGDGDADMYAPAAGNAAPDRLFIQTAPGVYAEQGAARLPAGASSDAGGTRFGDFDNDGDLDIVVGEGYIDDNSPPGFILFNDGAGNFAPSGTTFPAVMDGINPDDVDLADIDRDFDLDILINAHNGGQSSLWVNDGNGNFSDGSDDLVALPGGNHYGPVFCDVDGDGDLDLLIDNMGPNYTEQLSLNDGNGVFSDATDQISGNVNQADDNIVACIDYDNDGDFDVVVGSLSTRERLFQNDGNGNFTAVGGAFDGPTDSTLWIEFGDYDGDGKLDLFTGQGEGTEDERLYLGTADLPADTRPPHVIAVEEVTLSNASETVVRFAISDNAVTDEGARLDKVFVVVGDQQVNATFMGGDLYRAVLPATSATTFTVCATDRAGNVIPGCPETPSEGGGGQGGGGQGGGAQGGAGEGGAPSTGGNGSGASGGSGGGGGDVEEGCGCSVPRGSNDARLAGLGLLALAGLARLGRRSKRGAR